MRILGLSLFGTGLWLTFGLDGLTDSRAWMLIIGSSLYSVGVEIATKRQKKRCHTCGFY